MAIGLTESIIEVGHIDPRHLREEFRADFRREPWRGDAHPARWAVLLYQEGQFSVEP